MSLRPLNERPFVKWQRKNEGSEEGRKEDNVKARESLEGIHNKEKKGARRKTKQQVSNSVIMCSQERIFEPTTRRIFYLVFDCSIN